MEGRGWLHRDFGPCGAPLWHSVPHIRSPTVGWHPWLCTCCSVPPLLSSAHSSLSTPFADTLCLPPRLQSQTDCLDTSHGHPLVYINQTCGHIGCTQRQRAAPVSQASSASSLPSRAQTGGMQAAGATTAKGEGDPHLPRALALNKRHCGEQSKHLRSARVNKHKKANPLLQTARKGGNKEVIICAGAGHGSLFALAEPAAPRGTCTQGCAQQGTESPSIAQSGLQTLQGQQSPAPLPLLPHGESLWALLSWVNPRHQVLAAHQCTVQERLLPCKGLVVFGWRFGIPPLQEPNAVPLHPLTCEFTGAGSCASERRWL